jgi:hypothetical protein
VADESVTEARKEPGGWLGAAFRRGKDLNASEPEEAPVPSALVLRGVKKIDAARLRGAMKLVTARVGDGRYVVASESVMLRVAAMDDWQEIWAYLNTPKFARRRAPDFWTGEMISVEDLDGWNAYVVDLRDPSIEPCECRDIFYEATAEETVCKHVLAALIAEGDEGIMARVREQEKRDGIAAALQKRAG